MPARFPRSSSNAASPLVRCPLIRCRIADVRIADRGPAEFQMRDIISLACQECKRRNYSTTKNKKKTSERLEFSKFCRFCRKHTSHKETK